MLFHSSIRKELGRSFGATLVVLATVVMTILLIRVLAQASRGSVNPSDVLLVMGYTLLSQLATILALSLFISIVATLSRMYRDSEMAIWFSSGRGLAAFLSPIFRFSWPVLAVIATLSLVAWPWANIQIQDIKAQYEQRGDIDRVAPGQFQESANGNRVFFIDKDSADSKSASNVFITARDHGRDVVTSARRGHLQTIGPDRFLILNDGQRVESGTDTRRSVSSAEAPTGLKISQFGEYGSRVAAAPLGGAEETPTRALSTLALTRNPSLQNQGELGWRFGLAVAGINFIIWALALSSVNPRAGRSMNLVFSLFAFVVYYNLLNLGQSWVMGEKISLGTYLLVLHGGFLALGLLLLQIRHSQWSWRSLLPARESRRVASA